MYLYYNTLWVGCQVKKAKNHQNNFPDLRIQ